MKKSTLKVLSLVMAIAMILGTLTAIPFSALPGSNGPVAVEEHVHTKSGDAIKVVEPTCTLYGYSVYECECGKTFIADVTEKTEHNYQEVGEIPADCATGTVGYTAGVKCVVCGDVKSGCFEIEPEHKDAYRIIDGTYKFDEEGNVVTTPDCTAGVTYQHYCAACGQILENNVNTIVDYLNNQDDDHDYTIEVRDDAPTCEEGGYLYVVCEREGAYYFGDCAYEGPVAIYVAALGHDWSDPIEDEYGDPFKKYTQCTRCGAIEEIPEPEEPDDDDDDPDHPVQPDCHNWVSNGFVFSIGGEANLSSREFTGTAAEYLTQYAIYSNISDLYELFACTICNRTRLVLRVEKLDKEHLYGDYTFNFEGKVLTLNPEYNPDVEDSQMYLTTEFGVHNPDYDPEDEESEEYLIDPFSTVLRGGIYTEYVCGEKTVTTKVCAFCDALGIEPTEDDIEESDNELAHRYSEYWLCQNEECKKMVKVGTTTDEQTGEEVDVFEEERPMVSVDLGTNGIITLPLTDGYYKCGDCTHAHVTKVCFNPVGTLVERENWTLTVIGDDTTPEATPDLPKVYEQLFEIELDKEEAKKDYSDIALCMDFDGAQFEATEHEFGRNVIETGDCLTRTVEYKVCKICGSKYDVVEGDYGDHNWTEWEHLDPTCQQYECDQRHCTICGLYEEKNVGEYGDHQLGEWETVQEADCQHQEIKERYCTVDGCEYFEREVGEFGDHDMEFIVDKDANCVDTGKGHYTCSVCGAAGEKNVEIPIDAENHKGPVTAETTVEPTCTEEGVRVYTCAACGESWEEEIEKIPHDWDIIEAKEATCFEAGNKRYERCKVCGEYGKDEETGEEFKGELILAYKHEGYIAEKTLENGDVAKEATVWVAVTDPNFKAKDYALRIRAVEVETKVEEEVEYYGYTIRYVEPTCTRDGYVIGKYCTKCAEIYGNEDLIADIEGEFNYTGYIIPATGNHKIVHIVSDPEALPAYEVCGGEVYYAYAVDYCVVCGKYYQEEAEDNEGFEPVYFDMLTAKEHRPEFDDELFDETGALEPVIYTVVFDGEAFIELTADNAEDYPDCTYARYTAKKCRFCGKYFDITLKTEAFGHYYVNDGQGNKLFLMDCDKYDAKYVGVACSACGGIVPEYSVEPITEGEFTGYARECYWVSLDGSNMVPTYDRQLVKALGYLLVEHNNIAATQSVCDGYVIIECADCGLTFVNIEIEGIEHEYLLREGGYDAFKLEDYDKYAFDNVVYPTVTSEGFGTLTCIKCGEVLEVTIPALTAELSVSFDDFDEIIREDLGEYGIKNVIVGDEVTATIKITAKNFKFHNFKIFIDTWTDHFDLVGVEVLYDFGDVNAVNSYVDNGYVYLDCINSIGNAVVEEANDAEFLRITFKSGDLTYEDACTAFSWGIDEAEYSVIDEDGDVDYGYAGLANDGWFGGDINVYNPDYYYSAIEVLEAAYNDGYAAQYDFNKDGRVDLVDYFAMVDYITSAQTIADFCELIGYDLEAVIDGLEYRDALNKCEVVNTPDGPLTIYRTLDNLKDNVRIAFASANYRESIIEAGVTIAQFAQNVINNI